MSPFVSIAKKRPRSLKGNGVFFSGMRCRDARDLGWGAAPQADARRGGNKVHAREILAYTRYSETKKAMLEINPMHGFFCVAILLLSKSAESINPVFCHIQRHRRIRTDNKFPRLVFITIALLTFCEGFAKGG